MNDSSEGRSIGTPVLSAAQGAELIDYSANHAVIMANWERAKASIVECRNLAKLKGYSEYSGAMADWARIAKNFVIEREGKAFRTWCCYKAGIEAREKNPKRWVGGVEGSTGPTTVLRQHGWSKADAKVAVQISNPKHSAAVQAALDSPDPPSPSTLRGSLGRNGSAAYLAAFGPSGSVGRTCVFADTYTPSIFHRKLQPQERAKVAARLRVLRDWVNEFLKLCGDDE